MRWLDLTLSLAVLAVPSSSLAHHSVGAMYDREKVIALSGRVTKVQLMNPHSLIEVEVRGARGDPALWSIETANASGMNRMGVTHDTLAVGDRVKLLAYPGRKGERQAWLTRLETTRKVFNFSFRSTPAPTPTPVD